MSSLLNLFSSAEQASEFAHLQQETMRLRNQDLRTLDLGKALHALAETLGFSNWHTMKRALDERQAQLANASPNDGQAPSTSLSPQAQKTMSLLQDIENLSRRYDEIDVDDFDELQELHDDFESEGFFRHFASGCAGVIITIALTPSESIQMIVDPEDKEVQSANITVSLFEGKTIQPVPSEHLEALGRLFADQIESELLGLITG